MPDNQKICKECKEVKDITEFAKHPHCKDGITNTCKACKHIYNHLYYQANRQIICTKFKRKYHQQQNMFNVRNKETGFK